VSRADWSVFTLRYTLDHAGDDALGKVFRTSAGTIVVKD
jgi:hypothetical protein